MSNLWVLVADSSKARFFEGLSPQSELSEFYGMANQDVRRKEQELVTDKPGKTHDDQGYMRGANESDAKGHETDKFANQNKFKHLSIVAEAKMLGRIRHSMGVQTNHRVLEEVTKNLTTSDEKTIRKHLARIPVQ